MPETSHKKPDNERPADLAVQDSVGGMARRLLNPAHLRDLAGPQRQDPAGAGR